MRIAIYHNLPSGGGKRALCEMVQRLAKKHEVDVYALSCAEHDFGDLRPYCRKHIVFPFATLPLVRRPLGRLNQAIRALDLLRLRRLQRQIANHVDAGGYDVVFVHHCRYSQSPGLLQFLSTPNVYYCQEPPRLFYEPVVPRLYAQLSTLQRLGNCFDPLPAFYRALLMGLDRANVRSASAVLVNSAYSRESLYRVYGIFAQVCYLGVDARRFRPLSLARDDFVLSVGSLDSRKGFDFLLRSLALISPIERPPLVIVSNYVDDCEREHLQALAQRLAVMFSCHVLMPDDDLIRLYNQARLTLYAPIMEPFGFVPLESMASGTPVVGVCEGGVRETILDGVTGRLVERDPEMMADAIHDLGMHPDRVAEMGQRGRDWVQERWTWEQCVMRVEQHLEKASGVRK